MARFYRIDTSSGTYSVDFDAVYILLRALAHAEAIRDNSGREPQDWGFMLPTTFLWTTDWAKVRSATKSKADESFEDAWQRILDDPETMRANLKAAVRAINDLNRDQVEKRRATQANSLGNIEATISNLETTEAGLELVRDLCAETLVVGATVMTGGAAGAGLAALGGASVFKGVVRYQDTHNIGAAVVDTTGTFLTGAVLGPAGGAASAGEKRLLFLVGAGVAGEHEAALGLMEGEDMRGAALSGGRKMVAEGGGEFALHLLKHSKMGRFAIPVAGAVKLVAEKAGHGHSGHAPSPILPLAARLFDAGVFDEGIVDLMIRPRPAASLFGDVPMPAPGPGGGNW